MRRRGPLTTGTHPVWSDRRSSTLRRMSAFIVYQAEVHDPEQYERYKAKAGPALEAAGARYLVRGGDIEVLEGEAPAGRTVIIEFPSKEAAVEFFHSPEYTAIRALRADAADARMYVVDGYDG